mgnify:CR=1 FL=1
MLFIHKCIPFIMAFAAFISHGQTEELFHGLEWQESLSSTRAKIEAHAEDVTIYSPNKTSFPLAKKKEQHLVCLNYKSERGIIQELVFTFADDKLVYIEAYGNAVKALTGHRKDTAQTYMDYSGYWKDLTIAKIGEDKVWLLTPEAAHPNLFTWNNPYLPVNKNNNKPIDPSVQIPEYLKMGASLEELKPALEAASVFTYEQQLDGSDPNAQLQIDCFGVPYAGFPRKFEARFGDGKLNMVWILTGKGEEERLRQSLEQIYGAALYQDEAWEAYNNWQLMLRKDKPEILVLTPELAEFYRKDYFKQ